MNHIGIDMSKDDFHAAFDEEHVLRFRNTDDGLESFMTFLEDHGYSVSDTKIGVEATGVYHLLLAMTLSAHEWDIFVINPLESHRMITQGLRTVKTDRRDAQKIRTMVSISRGYLFTDTKETLALKALVVERQSLVEMRTALKQRITAHILKEKASGIPFHDGMSEVRESLDTAIKGLEKHMGRYESETQELLRSIPGIGKTTAATLVAFIGNIHRFDTPEKLTAYIGLDCRVFQSGTSVNGKGYISKRGNTYLRHILFTAAFIARQHNPDLQAYFLKKTGEGKHYFSALCAVERKLVHLVYAVWRRGTPYEKR